MSFPAGTPGTTRQARSTRSSRVEGKNQHLSSDNLQSVPCTGLLIFLCSSFCYIHHRTTCWYYWAAYKTLRTSYWKHRQSYKCTHTCIHFDLFELKGSPAGSGKSLPRYRKERRWSVVVVLKGGNKPRPLYMPLVRCACDVLVCDWSAPFIPVNTTKVVNSRAAQRGVCAHACSLLSVFNYFKQPLKTLLVKV